MIAGEKRTEEHKLYPSLFLILCEDSFSTVQFVLYGTDVEPINRTYRYDVINNLTGSI
jgi:hypothetical protein